MTRNSTGRALPPARTKQANTLRPVRLRGRKDGDNSTAPPHSAKAIKNMVFKPPSQPTIPQSPDAQLGSRLTMLPQELRNMIWTLYYAVNQQATITYRGKFEYNKLIDKRSLDVRSLRLTCRTINNETNAIRFNSPWKLWIQVEKKSKFEIMQHFGEARIVPLLARIEGLTIGDFSSDGLCQNHDDFGPNWKRMWSNTLKALPKRRCLRICSSENNASTWSKYLSLRDYQDFSKKAF